MSYRITKATYDAATHSVQWWATFALPDGTEDHGPHQLRPDVPLDGAQRPVEDFQADARAALVKAPKGDRVALRAALELDVQRVEKEILARKAAPEATEPVSLL